MERNKLSARSPIVRELGAENTKYSNSSKIRCFLYIFAIHSNSKILQHKGIFLYQRYSHTHQACTKSAHYWEVGTRGDGSLMGAIGQKPLGVATSHGIQGGLVCSAVGKH